VIALQGELVMAKVEDWNRETIFTDNTGLYSTTATKEIGEKKR